MNNVTYSIKPRGKGGFRAPSVGWGRGVFRPLPPPHGWIPNQNGWSEARKPAIKGSRRHDPNAKLKPKSIHFRFTDCQQQTRGCCKLNIG